jgi:tetratricopeptide (TPR) repeat protein
VGLSLNNLSDVFRDQGDYEQAKLHHQRALQVREKALGADHFDVAASLNNLGNVFRDQGEYEQAKLHYQRALQIWEKALGADHPDVAHSLVGLAKVALAQKEFESARAHAERAVSIRQASEVAPDLLAEARFLLAQALWSDRPQRARARELAEQARDTWIEVDAAGQSKEHLAEAETWLAEHQVPSHTSSTDLRKLVAPVPGG